FASEISLNGVTITTTSSDDTIIKATGTSVESFHKLGTVTLTSEMTVGDGVVVTGTLSASVAEIFITAPTIDAHIGTDTTYNISAVKISPPNHNTGRFKFTPVMPAGATDNPEDFITITETQQPDGSYVYTVHTIMFPAYTISYTVSVYERPSIHVNVNAIVSGDNNTRLRFNPALTTGQMAQEAQTVAILQPHQGGTVDSLVYSIQPDSNGKTALKGAISPNTAKPEEPSYLITSKIAESDDGTGTPLTNADYPITNKLKTVVTYKAVGTAAPVVVELITPITVKKT
ncbi:hypothetical protein, partial [Herbiconiux daphne]